MNKLYNILISMKTMGVLILIFAISIAIATFLENDFGTAGAKAAVYNATWFEALLGLLGLNLVGNIFKYKLYRQEKWPQFLFHISFILVLIGAAITRFISYEGVMHIREGGTADFIVSSDEYLIFETPNQRFSKKVLFSTLVDNSFESNVNIEGKEFNIKYIDFIPNAAQELVEDPNGTSKLVLVTADQMSGRQTTFLEYKDSTTVSGLNISFESGKESPFMIKKTDTGLMFKSFFDVNTFKIGTQEQAVLQKNQWHPFNELTVHSVGSSSLVLKQYYDKASLKLVAGNPKSGAPNALKIEISSGDFKKEFTLFGTSGTVSQSEGFVVDGKFYYLSYGAKKIPLPFSITLKDFELERYPGSNSPSSYASEVILIDKELNINTPFRIFMNNILNHRGYRFYQSSYDPDELGTILSVNHDFYGTLVTYMGYIIMAIGMFWTLLSKNSRFYALTKRLEKLKNNAAALLLIVATLNAPIYAQDTVDVLKSFDYDHTQKFGTLQVQDTTGRIVPVNTLENKIINKLSHKDSIYGLHPNQVLLGMLTRPQEWQSIKVIYVSHPEIRKMLGDENRKLFAFIEFFKNGQYVIGQGAEEASRKAPKNRDKFDKDIIKIDERVNISYMVYTGQLFKIFPFDGEIGWFDPMSAMQSIDTTQSMPIKEVFTQYFYAVDKGVNSGDWSEANTKLEELKEFQRDKDPLVVLDESRVNLEVLYYELNIFQKLVGYFAIIGFILLILQITSIIKENLKISFVSRLAVWLLIAGFIAQTFGLILRWYISGHAPWSDGYESMIYISWATILAGFIFSKNSPIALSATSILAGLILFVAHLSWMDPQITNLVPVLKSYWLTIHVAIITASYGFLGLGALLGFINMIFMILQNQNNYQKFAPKIKELTYINEKTLLIGLILITIGNFLGGVWANESWGRYWGWDPKETWALVTILVYSFVLHMRFIPVMNNIYTFNAAALFGFSSVIMTYFGVNFYLSGMHSYAKGDPVPIPDWVFVTIIVTIIIAIVAKIKYNIYKDK